MYTLLTGTHDVIGVRITNSSIETVFSLNSRAAGSLLTFMFISNSDSNIDFSKSVFLPLDKNTSLHYTLPSQLQPGLYHISVYDIEEAGTPNEGIVYPAYSKVMNLNNTQGEIYSLYYALVNIELLTYCCMCAHLSSLTCVDYSCLHSPKLVVLDY